MAINTAPNKNGAKLHLKSARDVKSKPIDGGDDHDRFERYHHNGDAVAINAASTTKNGATLHLNSARTVKPKPIDGGNDQRKDDNGYHHFDNVGNQPNSNADSGPFSIAKYFTCFSPAPGNDYNQSALARQAEDVYSEELRKKDMEAELDRRKKKKKKAKKAALAKKAKELDVAEEAANAKIKRHEEARAAVYARYRQAKKRADDAKKASEIRDKRAADARRQVTKLKVTMRVSEMEAKWAKKMAKKEARRAERAGKKAHVIEWRPRPDDDSVETVLTEYGDIDHHGQDIDLDDVVGLEHDVEDLGNLMSDMMEEASLLMSG